MLYRTCRRILSLTLIFLMPCLRLSAQSNHEPGSWTSLGFNYNINDKLKVLSETQLRSLDMYNMFYYYELRASLRYTPFHWISVASGLSHHNVYKSDGNFSNPSRKETRIYEEVFIRLALSRFNFENRNRLEQRFTPDGYKNRLRPRLALTLPVNNPEVNPGTFFLSFTEELFFSDFLEKSQFFIGPGYKFETLSITTGLKNDYNYESRVSLNFFQISVLFEI